MFVQPLRKFGHWRPLTRLVVACVVATITGNCGGGEPPFEPGGPPTIRIITVPTAPVQSSRGVTIQLRYPNGQAAIGLRAGVSSVTVTPAGAGPLMYFEAVAGFEQFSFHQVSDSKGQITAAITFLDEPGQAYIRVEVASKQVADSTLITITP